MKLISSILIFLVFNFIPAFSDENLEFEIWKKNFKKIALQNNVSEKTFDTVMSKFSIRHNCIKCFFRDIIL